MQFLSLRTSLTKRAAVVTSINVASSIFQQTCCFHQQLIKNNNGKIKNTDCCTNFVSVVSPVTSTAKRSAMTEVRPGDWLCANCGENNFRFRTSCNLCNKPRSTTAGTSESGDNNNGDEGRGSRPPRSSSGDNNNGPKRGLGDWDCKTCNSLNFKFRTECYSCREPRPAADIAAANADRNARRGSNNSKKGSELTEENMKPGDWKCTDCGSINFRGRSACFSCRTPKSSNAVTAERKTGAESGRVSQPKPMKKGDWLCQSCSEHNFADRTACFRCGLPRGDAKGYEPSSSSSETTTTTNTDDAAVKSTEKREKRPPQEPQEGDWLCAECGTNNFRRRAICFKCKKQKPLNAASAVAGSSETTTTSTSTETSTSAEPKQDKKTAKKKEEKPDDPLDDL